MHYNLIKSSRKMLVHTFPTVGVGGTIIIGKEVVKNCVGHVFANE